MIKTVDVGLMANHLSAHQPVIKRLELYAAHVQNQSILTILEKQIQIMKNHVNVMNQLLDPKQSEVTLPPIPINPGMTSRQADTEFQMNDQDIAKDARFTASSMAKENFNSAENMKDKQVKKLHSEMALQQSAIAELYETLMTQMGWINQPNASVQEQTSVMAPLSTMPNPQSVDNQQPEHFN